MGIGSLCQFDVVEAVILVADRNCEVIMHVCEELQRWEAAVAGRGRHESGERGEGRDEADTL